MKIATIGEQVDAYIKKSQFELVCKCVNKKELDISDYDLVFTASPIEVMQYLKDNFELADVVNTEKGKRDGFYAIKRFDGCWNTYRQERNIKFDEKVVNDSDLWKQIVNVDFGLDI